MILLEDSTNETPSETNARVKREKQKAAEKVGDHFLTNNEVQQLLHDLRHEFTRFRIGESIRNLIQLCFYTGGQRPYELAATQWDCVDLENKTLLIKPEISKNKKPHLIPLTDSAITIIKLQQEVKRDSLFIFSHRFDPQQHIRLDSLSQSITRYRDATDIRPFIPRDLSRTCKTLMGELGISKSIRDRLLKDFNVKVTSQINKEMNKKFTVRYNRECFKLLGRLYKYAAEEERGIIFNYCDQV